MIIKDTKYAIYRFFQFSTPGRTSFLQTNEYIDYFTISPRTLVLGPLPEGGKPLLLRSVLSVIFKIFNFFYPSMKKPSKIWLSMAYPKTPTIVSKSAKVAVRSKGLDKRANQDNKLSRMSVSTHP